ncbi:MAG: LysR family transcriptional regulator [Lachnospiraceae bacterium]|nr:LysR family transcriptional regulator [Lachnospiraceae bacterium]
MDIKNLITFIHVAEKNSFTKAARVLGYSQSTVSFQIRQLETELNAQLFERINHTIALTEQGREVLAYAHRISALTRELECGMKEEKEVAGHFRLAVPDSLCDSLLEKGFADFRSRYPGITLKITATGTEEMFRLMDHNEADAILTLDNHIYNTEYVIVREEQVGMHFVAPPEHSLCMQKKVSVRELVKEPFVLTEKGMSYRRLMDERLAALSLEIHPVLELGSTRLLCSLVEQGVGLSYLPDYVTEAGVKAGRLMYIDVADFEIEIWKQLLYHKDKWVSPQMRSVIEYCIQREFEET